MNEQTQKLVEQLASKLGVTVEHLWGVLIHQAPISAGIWLFDIAISLTAAALMIRKSIALFDEDEASGLGIALVSCGIVMLIFTVVSAAVLSDQIAAGFFNPEYWAFRQIVK